MPELTDPFAERVAEMLRRRLSGEEPAPKPPTIPPWASRLLSETKKRARKRGIKCKLNSADMASMIEAAGGCCQVSGIPFDFSKGTTWRRPFAPSIDRIDCGRGYVESNCRLVIYAANAAMNEWGLNVLLTLARGVVKKHGADDA